MAQLWPPAAVAEAVHAQSRGAGTEEMLSRAWLFVCRSPSLHSFHLVRSHQATT
jgi:hypothetical protein